MDSRHVGTARLASTHSALCAANAVENAHRLHAGAGDACAGQEVGLVLGACDVDGACGDDSGPSVSSIHEAFAQRAEAYGLCVASLDDLLRSWPAADPTRPSAYILYHATNGFHMPLPVGRFGNPFLQGWLWGDIDSRRLFGATECQGRIDNDSREFKTLAAEATQLPFAFRSMAQRLVVSWALRNQTLPLPGWTKEVDILFECKHNPNRVPFCVRRQPSASKSLAVIYTEWDILDLDCYIVYRAARPRIQSSRSRGGGGELDWPAAVRAAIAFGIGSRMEQGNINEYRNGPQPYSGSGEPGDVFQHLVRCGLHEDRLIRPEGDFRLFMERYAAVDDERKVLQAQFRTTFGKAGQDKEQAWIDGHRSCPPIPDGRPVLRIANDYESRTLFALGPDGLDIMVKIVCTHNWKTNNTGTLEVKSLTAYVSFPRRDARVIQLSDIRTETRQALKLNGIDLRRLRTADGHAPAFSDSGESRFIWDNAAGTGSWSVCLDLKGEEALRHGASVSEDREKRNVWAPFIRNKRRASTPLEGSGPKRRVE
ncbi:hypothetical protein AURDEDRAFT_177113 [Auricularia subglabra TFB-10046 SS5]|uniref:Uncharacterized protein n=1 Tax=Auricularia subglabra (strain TFB-10046 / SS5) TaxID=717982 RepID=J0LBI8_AURST|nr:hypothetical protein AURDEDRAFT_177113 [Auricularia subglabra TFB-10046 SS5]